MDPMITRPALPQSTRIHTRHRGLSLVELLVSMVIGLVIIGVVFANYLTSGTGKNSNTALSQMSEDATTALNFLRKQITQAGYSRAYALGGTNGIERFYSGRAIFGCDGEFANPRAPVISELTCKDGDGPSIAIAYEADERNSVLRKPEAGDARPGDCEGAAIAESLKGGKKYYVAESRLFLSDAKNGTLSCKGNAQDTAPVAGGAQLTNKDSSPLINNIESMRIRYGVAKSLASAALPLTPVKFVKASEIGNAATAAWKDVVAVRICVVVRSEDEVMQDKTPYYDCDAVEDAAPKPITPTDRRLYRAFTTTVMVQNRLGG
ncbi:MAG: hypothetical protein C0487_13805 [Leptothrix sp. (in: Bacteria)]|nr:hypothetical protein [Leptothrix sp. (in: b-proteobacteria)]